MSQVYGVCHSSVVYFFDYLTKFCADNGISTEQISLVENHLKNIPKSKILVFPDFNSLATHSKLLQKRRSIIFIIDCIPQLYGIENLTLVDSEGGDPGSSYQFYPKKIDRSKLRKALRPLLRGVKPDPLDLEPKRFEIIPKLVKASKEGMVLDKLNNLVYRTTDLSRREQIRSLILACLTGSITVGKLGELLGKFVRRGLGALYLQELLGFLRSAPGQNYVKALSQAAGGKKKSVNADQLAKTYGVDPYEIKYLLKMWRSSNRSDCPNLGSLSAPSYIPNKRRNKGSPRESQGERNGY